MLTTISLFCALIAASVHGAPSDAETSTIESTLISLPDGTFGTSTEAAGIDMEGNIYMTNVKGNSDAVKGQIRTIAKVSPNNGSVMVVTDLKAIQEGKVLLNGVRFNKEGDMFIADANGRKIWKQSKEEAPTVVCDFTELTKAGEIDAPNDLVISDDGVAYVSGMNYGNNIGGIFSCLLAKGTTAKLYEGGRTNGIDLSPDMKTLYFTEGKDAEESIMQLDLATKKTSVVYKFPIADVPKEADLDGMRTDIKGNIYVTVNGAGKVAILKAAGKGTFEKAPVYVDISSYISNPTNLEIGMRDMTPTVFVVGSKAEKVPGIVAFEALNEGRQLTWLNTKNTTTTQ